MLEDDIINQLAKAMWDRLNELDFDPMSPQWRHFDDPIKGSFIAAAKQAYESTNPVNHTQASNLSED